MATPATLRTYSSSRTAIAVASGHTYGSPASLRLLAPPGKASLVDARRVCAWCLQSIPLDLRIDAVCCSTACRQARHRFRVDGAGAATGRAMRFGYADPPYPGLARRYYGCSEVDHAELVARLEHDCPDGWALSTSSCGLRIVLPLCPDDVRICAFIRGERRGVAKRPRDAWEALIVRGGRPLRIAADETCCNVLEHRGRHRSHPGALPGMKPPAFAQWLFRQLGALAGDELVDYFPGSGAVSRAWAMFQRRDPSRLEVLRVVALQARRVPTSEATRRAAPRDASRAAASYASREVLRYGFLQLEARTYTALERRVRSPAIAPVRRPATSSVTGEGTPKSAVAGRRGGLGCVRTASSPASEVLR